MASSTDIEEFLASPLVAWLKSCVEDIDNKLDSYENFFDGFPFREVLLKIDPDPVDPVPSLSSFLGDVSLVSARIQIFHTIISNIQTIYMAEFNQVVTRVPDIMILAQEPSTRNALEQLKLIIHLLLGCAVQGPTQEYFVSRITILPNSKQEEIAALITAVCAGQTIVINNDGLLQNAELVFKSVFALAEDRNNYQKYYVEDCRRKLAAQSCVVYENEKERQLSRDATHLAVEIVDYKSQIRKLKQTIDERNDNIIELTEELEKIKAINEKLHRENGKLVAERIKIRRSEDEWEALRDKAEQAEYLEKEAIVLRRNLIDAKSNKNRLEELLADNKVLERNQEVLEAQLAESRKKGKRIFEVEGQLLNAQKCINDLELELEASRSKIEDLEKHIVELQQISVNAEQERVREEESEFELSGSFSTENSYCFQSGHTSIQEELNNNAQAKILQLQLEKRQLEMAIDEIEQKTFYETAHKVLELEKEKKKLSLQCESLQSEVDRLNQGNIGVEKLFKDTIEENVSLQQKLEAMKTLTERQAQDLMLEKERQTDLQKTIDFFKKEKENVLLLCDAIKNRADKADKSNIELTETVEKLRKDVEKGKEMERTNEKLNDKVESLEKEIASLQKELAKSKELLEVKSVDLDQTTNEISKLERQLETFAEEKSEMLEQLEKLQVCERKAQELLSQAAVHSETITALQKDLVSEKVNNERFKSNVEKLGLSLDVLENDVNVVLEKMLDNLEVSKVLTAIYKTRDNGVVDVDKLEEMASSLTEEWRQEVEKLQAEIAGLQASNESLKTENASLQVDVSTLKSQLQSLQVQQTALQLANSQLVAEKEDLSRQNQMQQTQQKTLSHDQDVLSNIHAELTAEYEKLLAEKENLKRNNRDLKSDVRTYVEKLENLENRLKSAEQESEKANEAAKHLSYLRVEHSKLKSDFRNLLATSERLSTECKSSREELQTLRAEFRDLKSANVEMKNELSNKIDIITTFQMENAVLQQKCEMLQENLNKLDLTRISLLDSFSELCKQSLVCMADSMDRQNHSQMEAKRHWEQYNNILRQKDKLEEKIFDFYKKLDNVNTKKGGFASLVRRVRKAGSGIMSRSRSTRRSSEEETAPATPSRTIQAEPQVAGPSCSGSAESNNSSNGNESDDNISNEDPIATDRLRRTPSGGPNGHRPRDEVALRRSQRHQSSRRNSVASEELLLRDTPSLGSIGSRRTVYISEDEPVPSPTPIQQTPLRDSNPPLLVYNRISTVIGGDTLCTLGNQTNLPEIPRENLDGKKPTNPKETAVWYEYGCV
ncbi:girdin [Coccinella septempunctata]|uniref:girdin n=1 Tax=Coccinella septempunctata TaxID=41139 RepID=UPI001D067100|nr:girdin [Coccinella septempunctata]